jgi:hypothetical protein
MEGFMTVHKQGAENMHISVFRFIALKGHYCDNVPRCRPEYTYCTPFEWLREVMYMYMYNNEMQLWFI